MRSFGCKLRCASFAPHSFVVKWQKTRKFVSMKVKSLFSLVLFLPSLLFAANPCKDSKTTLEMNDCLATQAELADKELAKYLEASRRHYSDEPKVLAALDKAQNTWLQFREAQCAAVYEIWSGGTIRDAMYGYCRLEQTRRRTHDLWKTYLTFMDSTPPLLPEPPLDEKRK
jgi:uncharacterized protein YecT (DUF1311 family)